MKTSRLAVAMVLAGLVALSAPGAVQGDDGLGPQLTAEWWQWVFSIPSSVHPLTFKATDPTGAAYCMVGQHGDVWFLGGVFKTVDVATAMRQAQTGALLTAITPIVIERECTIPLGKIILMPVLNAECNTAEELALGNDVPENLVARTQYLRNCAKTLADAVNEDTASAQFGPVSAGVWAPTPVNAKRVHTPLPFSVTYAPDNIFSTDCPAGPSPFLCEPDPNPSLAHVDGYWAKVQPPKIPGTYRLETFGEVPAFDFALRVIYTLTIVGPSDQ